MWGGSSGRPDNNPKEFNNILGVTGKTPSSVKVTRVYYNPTTIKLTVNPPSYMTGASTNTLTLTSQNFKLENDISGAEFSLTWDKSKGNKDHKVIDIRKIRDYDVKGEKMKEAKEKADKEASDRKKAKELILENEGAQKVNVKNDTKYKFWIAFQDKDSTHQNRISLNPHSTDSTPPESHDYHYANDGGNYYFGFNNEQPEQTVFYNRDNIINFNIEEQGASTDVEFKIHFTYDFEKNEVDVNVTATP